MFENVYVVSMARTAVGSFGGSLKSKNAIELGSVVAKEALHRAHLTGDEIDEVVFGNVGQYGLNAFLARMVSLNAGVRKEASAQTVNRMCASGLQAIITGAMLLEHNEAQAVLVGGAEHMSSYPYLIDGARWGMRMGVAPNAMLDSLTVALCEPVTGVDQHVGITAENIAAKYNLTREMIDTYALEGQKRARTAIEAGYFKEQIVAVEVKDKKKTFQFDTDEHPRETSMEKLGKLAPIIKPDGVVTAGNASGINDGAAALVLMTKQAAARYQLTPVARLIDFACAGVDPMYMGLGPVAATRKLLDKCGMPLSQIDLIELNEAFGAQALACMQELKLDPSITNVNGSGIALGHPLGATGAIISIKLLCEMQRRGLRYGLATLCIGGGQGMSALFECL